LRTQLFRIVLGVLFLVAVAEVVAYAVLGR
jgi:hypothetical protein